VFLFNFPTSRSEEISRMVERVKEGIGGLIEGVDG
jgi:hypothetical protein